MSFIEICFIIGFIDMLMFKKIFIAANYIKDFFVIIYSAFGTWKGIHINVRGDPCGFGSIFNGYFFNTDYV